MHTSTRDFHGATSTVNPSDASPSSFAQPLPQYTPAYSSHYLQAYLPPQQSQTGDQRHYRSSNSRPLNANPPSLWYQHGDKSCTYNGCRFSGSQKSVEVHMMDRHLIYPPGWKAKNKSDWDADPSLKGKPIPIQGTTIILDSPDVLEAWIAERKKRWPSNNRVEEKKRKMEEAISRGQLPIADSSRHGRKRPRTETAEQGLQREETFTTGRGRGRRRDRGRPTDAGYRRNDQGQRSTSHLIIPENVTSSSTKATPAHDTNAVSDSGSSSDEGDDGLAEPEVVSSKAPPTIDLVVDHFREDDNVPAPQQNPLPRYNKQSAVRSHPVKKTLVNPFVNRSSLLRNLILPEIGMTVSNLSQAIRFLVDNDFLSDVEARPGEASEKKIQVMDSIE